MVIGTRVLGAIVEINDRTGEIYVGEVVDVYIGSSILQTPQGNLLIQALHYAVKGQDGRVRCILAADNSLRIKALQDHDVFKKFN